MYVPARLLKNTACQAEKRRGFSWMQLWRNLRFFSLTSYSYRIVVNWEVSIFESCYSTLDKKNLKCWQLTEISCQLNTIVLKRPCKPDQSKEPVHSNTSFSCNISLQRFQFCDSFSVKFQQALIFSFIRFACALIECLLKAFDPSLSIE